MAHKVITKKCILSHQNPLILKAVIFTSYNRVFAATWPFKDGFLPWYNYESNWFKEKLKGNASTVII